MLDVAEVGDGSVMVVCESHEEAQIVVAFLSRVQRNLGQARASGALRGDESLGLLYKAVLRITAEQTSPFSDEGKALLRNLRHFV